MDVQFLYQKDGEKVEKIMLGLSDEKFIELKNKFFTKHPAGLIKIRASL